MFLVFSSYNTTGYSYYHLFIDLSNSDWPLKTFLGLVLLTAYGIFAIAIWRSMGPIGIATATAALTAMVWTLVDYGLLNLNNTNAVSTIVGSLIATLLALGVSWSHIRTRLSGQVDSKDVNQY